MMLGLVLISVLFGGTCGITAFCWDFGLFQSLVVYAVAGQMPFLLLPLLAPLFYLRAGADEDEDDETKEFNAFRAEYQG